MFQSGRIPRENVRRHFVRSTTKVVAQYALADGLLQKDSGGESRRYFFTFFGLQSFFFLADTKPQSLQR